MAFYMEYEYAFEIRFLLLKGLPRPLKLSLDHYAPESQSQEVRKLTQRDKQQHTAPINGSDPRCATKMRRRKKDNAKDRQRMFVFYEEKQHPQRVPYISKETVRGGQSPQRRNLSKTH